MNEGTALMVPPELSLSCPTLLTGTARSKSAGSVIIHKLFSSTSKCATPSPIPAPINESSAPPDNALKGIAALERFLEWT